MKMQKIVPRVSRSKYKKSSLQNRNMTSCVLLSSIKSGLKSNEIKQKGIPKFQTKNVII